MIVLDSLALNFITLERHFHTGCANVSTFPLWEIYPSRIPPHWFLAPTHHLQSNLLDLAYWLGQKEIQLQARPLHLCNKSNKTENNDFLILPYHIIVTYLRYLMIVSSISMLPWILTLDLSWLAWCFVGFLVNPQHLSCFYLLEPR